MTDTSPYAPAPSTGSLDAPLYGASFGQAIKRYYTRYATFTGRASRSEYWWIVLFNFLVIVVLAVLANLMRLVGGDGSSDSLPAASILFAILLVLFLLGSIVPGIALTVRRLHDGNFSGLLTLLHLVPYLGALVIAIFALLPSNPEGARYDRR